MRPTRLCTRQFFHRLYTDADEWYRNLLFQCCTGWALEIVVISVEITRSTYRIFARDTLIVVDLVYGGCETPRTRWWLRYPFPFDRSVALTDGTCVFKFTSLHGEVYAVQNIDTMTLQYLFDALNDKEDLHRNGTSAPDV